MTPPPPPQTQPPPSPAPPLETGVGGSMSKSDAKTVPDVREARERKRARRPHQTCLSRGVPPDREVQSQVRKDGYPLLVEAS